MVAVAAGEQPLPPTDSDAASKDDDVGQVDRCKVAQPLPEVVGHLVPLGLAQVLRRLAVDAADSRRRREPAARLAEVS